MSYEDFVFRLEANGNGWTARVLDSPAGEGSGPFALEIDPKECLRIWVSQADAIREGRRLAPPAPRPAPADLSQVAEALFRALFPEEVRRLWERSLGLAAPGWLRIQLRMDLREPGVAPLLSLPWELIQDPETGGRWGLSRRSPVVRYVETAQPRSSLSLPRPLRVLAVGSQPCDAPALQLEHEQRLVEQALREENGIEVVPLAEARLGALRDEILEKGCHVLHFMGHGDFKPGTGEGCLVFETPGGRSDPVSGQRLATTLGDLKSLRLVVLNACHGGAIRGGAGRDPFAGVASSLVRAGLPAVVAMQLPISDAAAIAFSRSFYRRLAAGDPIEVAVVEGRHAIHSEEHRSMEWAVPALFSRLGGGRLFDSSGEEPRQRQREPEDEPGVRVDAEEAVDRARRLLAAHAAGSLTDDVFATAFGELLAGEPAARVERVLVEALAEPPDDATARTAARAVTRNRRFTPDIAEALAAARSRDAAPWPIETALRAVAACDPDLLPHPRTSLRRVLGRRRDLAERFLGDGNWRRLGLFVYGGLDDAGEITLGRSHHESPELSREICDALEEDRPATSLVPALCRLVRDAAAEPRRDAALALAALGVPLDGLLPADELRPALERLRASLKTAPVSVRSFGVALARHLRSLEAPRRAEVVRSVLALVPQRPTEPAALLEVAETLPPEQRVPWLVELWRRVLSASHPRPVYNLAVVLDTAGEVLSDPPWLLARSLARAVLAEAAAAARTPRDELFAALDAVASLPRLFDFVRGWVLVRLGPLLNGAGLLPEALILALGLSDRLDARADTVRRLLAEDDPRHAWLEHPRPASVLVEMAQGVADPLLRFRAYRRLACISPPWSPEGDSAFPLWSPEGGSGWVGTRAPLLVDRLGVDRILLAPASSAVLEIDDPTERAWAREELKRLVSGGRDSSRDGESRAPFGRGRLLLAARVDEVANPVSVLVALALVEDLLPQTGDETSQEPQDSPRVGAGMGKPVSCLGVEALRRLARDWLDRREADPGTAVVLRWNLESVEHDDAEALAHWAGILRDGDRREAAEAEAILGNVHGVRGHVWPTVRDVLEGGCPRARRALLRSVGFLLARRRLPDDVWRELVPALRSLADDGLLAGEGFVLDGPAAVVSAGGAVRQVLADGTAESDTAVEVAERAYQRYRRPWSEALREPPDVLRRILASAGAERLVTARSRAEVAAAAGRVAEELPVFEVLLEWASRRMRHDVQHGGPDDYLVSDLLCVLAGAAERLPEVYLRKTRTLPLWERQLCEAARFCDWYPARRAALVLLGCDPEATPRTVAAFRDALHDVPEVSQAALRGLAGGRR